MVTKLEQPTLEAAVKNDKSIDNHWHVDSDNPSDADVPEDVAETATEGARLLDEAFESYDLPFDRATVGIAVVETDSMFYGKCTPIRCGRYDPSEHGVWRVEERPDKYYILLPRDSVRRYLDELALTVRHELAHAADWHENLKTTERTETHQEWLERLDAT